MMIKLSLKMSKGKDFGQDGINFLDLKSYKRSTISLKSILMIMPNGYSRIILCPYDQDYDNYMRKSML